MMHSLELQSIDKNEQYLEALIEQQSLSRGIQLKMSTIRQSSLH